MRGKALFESGDDEERGIRPESQVSAERIVEELILKKVLVGRNFEGKSTSNSGNQVGIKSENKWQKSYKDFQIIVNAIVLGHGF